MFRPRLVLIAATGLLAAIAFRSPAQASKTGGAGKNDSTHLEINLGPVPIDDYTSSLSNGRLGRILPRCPASYTVRKCYKLFFNNRFFKLPYTRNNYVRQGVTGVRFFFATGPFAAGSNVTHSAAWDSSGDVSNQWVHNLTAFLSDLRSYGISRVTLTPALGAAWGQTAIAQNPPVYDCAGKERLVFYPAMPFGLESTNGWPDCFEVNDGYSSAAANPHFWGWTPFFRLADRVFKAVKASGLELAEFDVYQETDLLNFTVSARMIYDNTTGTDVLSALRSSAASNGFDPNAITSSAQSSQPILPGYDCNSVYGDSATVLYESEMIGALEGSGSAIGLPARYKVSKGLLCGGNTSSMVSLPVSYRQPDINDLHLYVDSADSARTTYSGMWALLYRHGLTGNKVMIGETESNQRCDGMTPERARDNMAGYFASDLYAYHAALTTLRPWDNDANACYATPSVINPPYTVGHWKKKRGGRATAADRATISGTIRDDTGAVPPGITVQIRQLAQLSGITAWGRPVFLPGYSATIGLDDTGSFRFTGIPAGEYFVCAWSDSPGLLSNCEWTARHAPIGIRAGAVRVPIVLRHGSVVTIRLLDRAHRLAQGHRFQAGVITAGGYYAAARISSHDPGGSCDPGGCRYVTTIPRSARVRIFIDSDLCVTNRAGKELPSRYPSDIAISGETDVTIRLYVQ